MIKLHFILLVIAVAFAFGCTPATSVQNSQVSAAIKKDSTRLFQKVIFFALVKDDATRRIAEDKLAEQLKGRGVASYKYPGISSTGTNETILSEKLKQDGFDGLVLMRFTTVAARQPAPGNAASASNSWYSFYSNTFPVYSNPNNYSQANIYHVEINVYSLATDKLLWTGITSAVNTDNTGKMIDQLITMTKQQMKNQGFIK